MNRMHRLFSILRQRTINITQRKYFKVLKTVIETLKVDLNTFLATTGNERAKVVLVSVDRGGSVPTTIIDYSLGSFSKEKRTSRKLSISRLNLPLSTRDSKQGETNVEALTKVKANINQILHPTKLHYGRPIRIYVIDDLLDSGATLDLIVRSFKDETWYKQVKFVFLYHTVDRDKQGFLRSTHEFLPPFFTLDWVIHSLVAAKQLVIGKTLKTNKWLDFWYEKM